MIHNKPQQQLFAFFLQHITIIGIVSCLLGYNVYDNCDDEDLTVDLLYPGLTGVSQVCVEQAADTSDETYAGMFVSINAAEASNAQESI